MMERSSVLVAAVAAVGAMALAGAMLTRRRQKGGSGGGRGRSGSDDEDGVVDMPTITQAQVEEFFARANQHMAQTIMELEMKLGPYKDQLPAAHLHSIMQQQFEETLESYQDALLTEWDVSDEELQYATEFFGQETGVKQGVQQLKRMFTSVSGLPMTDVLPKDLTEAKFCEALPLFFDASIRAMADVASEMTAEGHDLRSPEVMQGISHLFLSRQDSYVSKELAPYGLSVDLIGFAVKHFENSREVMRLWQEGQARQQLELAKLGFA